MKQKFSRFDIVFSIAVAVVLVSLSLWHGAALSHGDSATHHTLEPLILCTAVVYLVIECIRLSNPFIGGCLGLLVVLIAYIPEQFYQPTGVYKNYMTWKEITLLAVIGIFLGVVISLLSLVLKRKLTGRLQSRQKKRIALSSQLSFSTNKWVISFYILLILFHLFLSVVFTWGAIDNSQSMTREAILAAAGDDDAAPGWDLVMRLNSVFILIAYVSLAVWTYQEHKNLEKLKAGVLKFTSGWAAAYYFIPLLHLIRVPQVIGEIWKASDYHREESSGYTTWHDINSFVLYWWFILIISNVFHNILWSVALTGRVSVWLFPVSLFILIPDHVLTIALVMLIKTRQRKREAFLLSGSSDKAENVVSLDLNELQDRQRGISVMLVALRWDQSPLSREELRNRAAGAVQVVDPLFDKDVMDVKILEVNESQQYVQLSVRADFRDRDEQEKMRDSLKKEFAG